MQTQMDDMRGQTTKAADECGQIDWKAELEGRWQALGHRIFVVEPERPPTLREVVDECSTLAVVWALVQRRGNFAYAARRFKSSRKLVRRYFLAWLRVNPTLSPMPVVAFLRWSERYGGNRR